MSETRDSEFSTADCSQMDEMLEPYVDGELDGWQHRQRLTLLERHLDGCAACRRQLQLVRAVSSELRAQPLVECPAGTLEEVMQRADAQPVARQWSFGWTQAAAMLAVLVAGLVGLRFVGDRDLNGAHDAMSAGVYSQDEIEQAEEDLRFALAYFGGIAQKAGLVLRDEVIAERVVEPPRRRLARIGFKNAEDATPTGVRKENP